MKVILKETIDTLGIAGTECEVAPGYGRNYLLPRGKAMLATFLSYLVAVVVSAEAYSRLQPEETLADILLDCPVKDWEVERDGVVERGLELD